MQPGFFDRGTNMTGQEMREVWKKYGGLCRYMARRNTWILRADPAISFEDLEQAAFIGLINAAESYEDKGKSFAGWAAWFITREFRRLLGWFNSSTPPPAHIYTQSLDVPAYGDADVNESKMDLLPDETAPDILASICANELTQAVTDALNRLALPQAQEILRMKFYQRLTEPQIAAKTGLTTAEVKSIIARSMRVLLRDWRLKRDIALWDELPSYSTSLQAFRANGSQTERAALWLAERKGA